MVNKISQKGAIWRTHEGQMALEGISGQGQSLGANVWNFAIDNYLPSDEKQKLVSKLQESMNSGKKVKIHYVEMVRTFPWRSESDVLIQNVDYIASNDRTEQKPTNLELGANTSSAINSNGSDVHIDGRHYMLKHDSNGKLRVSEIREVQ
ncbi:MAG: hypothetical protein AABX11_04140 [Nanoarchaeota archaeon]